MNAEDSIEELDSICNISGMSVEEHLKCAVEMCRCDIKKLVRGKDKNERRNKP